MRTARGSRLPQSGTGSRPGREAGVPRSRRRPEGCRALSGALSILSVSSSTSAGCRTASSRPLVLDPPTSFPLFVDARVVPFAHLTHCSELWRLRRPTLAGWAVRRYNDDARDGTPEAARRAYLDGREERLGFDACRGDFTRAVGQLGQATAPSVARPADPMVRDPLAGGPGSGFDRPG